MPGASQRDSPPSRRLSVLGCVPSVSGGGSGLRRGRGGERGELPHPAGRDAGRGYERRDSGGDARRDAGWDAPVLPPPLSAAEESADSVAVAEGSPARRAPAPSARRGPADIARRGRRGRHSASGAPRVRGCAHGGTSSGRVCLGWPSILQLGTVHRRELLNMSLLPLYLLGLLLSSGQGRSAAAFFFFYYFFF